jgi:hypothetical protein
MNKNDFNFSHLDMILVTNIILKYFNLINWSWKKTLWPLWVSIAMAFFVYIWYEWLES